MGQDYYCGYCGKSVECCRCNGAELDTIAGLREEISAKTNEIQELETKFQRARSLLGRVFDEYLFNEDGELASEIHEALSYWDGAKRGESEEEENHD